MALLSFVRRRSSVASDLRLNGPASLVDTTFAVGLLKAQTGLVIVVTLLALLCLSPLSAKSAVLGMLVAWLGSAFAVWRTYYSFAFLLTGVRPQKTSKQVVSSMMQAVMGKLFVVMVGLALVFKNIQPLNAGMLFLGLMLLPLMAWVYPLWLQRKTN